MEISSHLLIFTVYSHIVKSFTKFYANVDFMALINQLHEIDSRKANTASGF